MYRQTPLSETDLLKKAQNGDAEAFGCLYELHVVSVYRFIKAHLDNNMDVEDLTEEVFMRAWRALPEYHERGYPFRAFLFRIARNALIDFYRSSSSRPQMELMEDDPPEILRGDPDGEVMASLEQLSLLDTLAKLNPDYRTVLVARFLSGLSPDETAKMLGRSPGAVRVLQHRAVQALRKAMESGWSDKEDGT